MGDAKVSKDFSTSKYTDHGLSTKCGHVVEKMTGNPAFPTPETPLAEVTTALGSYNDALAKAENGSKADTVVKNNWRTKIEKLMKDLAGYVQVTSDGDEAVILGSGFDVNKKAATVGPLPKPENFSVKPGINKGTIIANCDAIENAYVYEFQYTETPVTAASIWVQKISTKHKVLIEGLVSGKQYSFRVAAVATDPTRNWSDELTSFVI